jgi:Xaa-Pro aminopeptidase
MHMLELCRQRTREFCDRLKAHKIPLAVITDQGSIAYLAGFWGYLSVEFGRPTILILRPDEEPVVVTPLMETEMVGRMTWMTRILSWTDSGSGRWENVLTRELGRAPSVIGVETAGIPAVILTWLKENYPASRLVDAGKVLGEMRMIKAPEEIEIMRQAGRIAAAMMAAAQGALKEDAPEYEAALAVIDAGTRTAAGFLTPSGWEAFVSPMIHNLQIMQSGPDTTMVHRRASVRRMKRGDPVYFCFCNMIDFKHYRLGFDRMFFIGEVADDAAHVQKSAVAAQQAALRHIREGAIAEDVAEAANEVYRQAGFSPGYRTGRSIGVSYLEAPELKEGDKTVLKAGMTFAVDGGISVEGKTGGRIGDSIVVTRTGFEYLTDYPRDLLVV